MKEETPRTGRAFLWALLAVIGGIGTTSILVAQTLDPGSETPEPDSAAAQEPEGNTITLTAADIVAGGEAETGSKASLFSLNTVAVPEEAEGKTVADALEEAARAGGRRLEYLATNVVDVLQEPYKIPGAETRTSLPDLCQLLLPAGYSAWEHDDGVYLFVGTDADVNHKRTDYAVERLAKNHTRIAFSANDMTIYDAVLRIRSLSKANILTAYMDKDDQHSDAVAQDNATLTAEGIGATTTNAVSNCRRVTYSTDGAELEWRTVLSSVLEPDYTFDEVDGKVRVATRARFAEMQKRDLDAKPMGLRYVRVYHANPEDIVERLGPMHVTQNSQAVIQVAPYQEKAKKDNVNSFRHNLASSSTTLSTGNTTIGDSGSVSSGSWGNLLRPKNPPAILVYDNEDNLDKVEKVIRTMDVREKQVLIEALILDLTDTGSRDLGLKLDEMGFGNIPLLGVSYSNKHDKNHKSASEQSWTGGSSQGINNYVGRGRGTSPETTKEKSTTTIINSDGKELYTGDTTKNTDTHTGIAPSWAYGNVSESFSENHMLNQHTYERSTSSLRDRAWSAVFGPLDFNFILEMVETKGNGKLLSSPVLTIGDHGEAMLHVGNVTPILNIETEVTSSTTSIVTEDVEWQELVTGILMWVGPEVSEDGKSVRLWVHPKISETTGEWETYRETRYPHLTSQEMDTRVTVPSGATLLMGGLTRTEKSETLKKVPILGDIPILGRLFRHTSTSSNRRNLVILIRPTILDDENPETGFEAPANAIIEPMMAESGRNLQDVVFKEEDDKMRQREKALWKAISRKKADDPADVEAEVEEAAAEGADAAETAAPAAESTEGEASPSVE